MHAADEGVCLRTVNYAETSQVVTLLTRSAGKLGMIAKGSRRARSSFDGPIELFSFGRIIYAPHPQGRLSVLTEFAQEPRFLALRRNLYAMNCGLFAAELVDGLTHEADPCPDLFERFVRFLDDVQSAPDDFNALALLILFQMGLLRSVGLSCIFGRCANCKRPFGPSWQKAFFSSSANGLVCPDCEGSFTDKVRLARTAARCLAEPAHIRQAGQPELRDAEKVLIQHFTYLLNRKPRLAAYFT